MKALSQRDLLVLAFGAMIGWGWIVLSGQWIDEGGPFGTIALVLSALFVLLYLPGGPSALVWPYEWLMVLLWSLLGIGLFAVSRRGRELLG